MKIEKYVTNKDITLTNDDIDTAKLIKDLQQGMISESEVNTKIENARKEWENEFKEKEKETTKAYSDLEEKYNDLEKRNGDLTTSYSQLKLENVMVREGFKEDDFQEVTQLRNSLYKDEKDDSVAIKNIKEKFNSTYFPDDNKPTFTQAPNEGAVKGNEEGKTSEPIKITRNTRLKDLLIK